MFNFPPIVTPLETVEERSFQFMSSELYHILVFPPGVVGEA